ncbi:hypothetical protein P170DRAFT_447716 [Aspergillus steynii IBT 23096]|uniref:Nephrocystin 3-like N-terminal domain-containing protein n=1 Tax=Aspergillus steynii IBT 23096 TaxID=1392250 RepID=A0A2I2G4P6_9EURO|nr:uncharacterized protein P170DRAFT_447716 [Aspergillus steynii IBT 23096]PLB47848.1 hypothetical protein P170DRAFT_447716 [Aspergillus steynii IBT 23096]
MRRWSRLFLKSRDIRPYSRCRWPWTYNLGRLHIAKGAVFNDYENQHTECLPGTRVKLLREIYRWIEAPDGKCIFWLNGMAGTGKSTITRTVVSRLKGQSLLRASFFFKRGKQDRGNAKLLFSTLTRQLGGTLILQPLIAVNPDANSIILVVIDTLDEYNQDVHLRFLLTSRPDLPIRLGFQGIKGDYQYLILHKIPNPVIKRDIRLYFKEKFRQAILLFISATTLFRFISDDCWSATERLRVIMSDKTRYLVQGFKNTIGILILLATPLSVYSLAKLLQLDTDQIQIQFKLFYSVLDVPARAEYLVNKRAVHAKLTVQYLKLMQDNLYGLRRNICNLKHDTVQRNDIDKQTLRYSLPPELRYACYPANKLVQALLFLQSHFLYWVEVISLLGIISELVEMIQRLRSSIQVHRGNFSALLNTNKYRLMKLL